MQRRLHPLEGIVAMDALILVLFLSVGFAQGAEPMPGTPQAFASFMREEMAKWAPVVKQAGVKLD